LLRVLLRPEPPGNGLARLRLPSQHKKKPLLARSLRPTR
jgi:hypothetical protein